MPTAGVRVSGRGRARSVGGVAVRPASAGAREAAHTPTARPHLLPPPVHAHAGSGPDEGTRDWGNLCLISLFIYFLGMVYSTVIS